MTTKQSILITITVSFVIITIGLFSSFDYCKLDIYPSSGTHVFVRKIKNPNTYINFIKPSAESLLTNGDLITHKNPIIFDTKFSKKENLCSRIIGLPGDIITIIDSKVFINQEAMKEDFDIYYLFRISTEEAESFNVLLNSYNIEIIETLNKNKACNIIATQSEVDKISKQENILNIRKITHSPEQGDIKMFTSCKTNAMWNKDNMGPIAVPQKDVTVLLKPKNIGIYKLLIEAHEDNSLFFDINEIEINGEVANSYTIKQNYYFVLNDNRVNKLDSRTLGFIPEDQILGKVIE